MEMNKIYCMDVFELMKQFPDKSVDIIITSPPYLDKEIEGDYYEFLDKFVSEAKRISKVILMFNSSRRIVEICRRYKDIQHILIWDKMFTLPAFKYEPIFVITKEKIWGRGRIYRDHLRYTIPRKKIHINQNPVELYEELLKFFPNANLILDPFVGSGTTAIACKKHNRNFICCDNNKEYVNIANERLKQEVLI